MWTKNSALEHLERNYDNFQSPISQGTAKVIYEYYDKVLPYTNIHNFLKSRDTYTSFRESRRSAKSWNRVMVHQPRQLIEMDLIVLDEALKKANNNTAYIACFIDVFTKKLFAVGLKKKSAESMNRAFLKVFQQMRKGGKIWTVASDLGKEYINATFQATLKDLDIKLKHFQALTKAPHVERVQRTLQVLIGKFIRETNSLKFIHALPSLVAIYNSRFHSSIGMAPNEAELNHNWPLLLERNELKYSKKKKYKPGIALNSLVRIETTGKFKRIYKPQNTDIVFEVIKIDTKFKRPLYTLRNLTGENRDHSGKYHEHELTELHPSMYFRVKDTKDVKNGYKECTFHGLPEDITMVVKNKPRLKGSRLQPLQQFIIEEGEEGED